MATVAVAAGLSVVSAIFNKNSQNIKLAKNENSALAQIIPWIQAQFQTVFDAANAGQISEQQAIACVTQIVQNYWTKMQPLIAGGSAATCGTAAADCKHGHQCTAGCCVGCGNIVIWAKNSIAVFQAGGGTAQFNQVFGSPKYGYAGQPAFSLIYRRPKQLSAAAQNNSQADLPLANLPIGNIGTAGLNGVVTPYSQSAQAPLNAASVLQQPEQTPITSTPSSMGIVLALVGVAAALGVVVYMTE